MHVPVTDSSPPLQVPLGERPSASAGAKRNPAALAGDEVEEWLRAREVQMLNGGDQQAAPWQAASQSPQSYGRQQHQPGPLAPAKATGDHAVISSNVCVHDMQRISDR